MISHEEYLEALKKVKLFHLQLEKEIVKVKITDSNAAGKGILELLAQNASNRLFHAVKYFLELETSYRKIPYPSAEDVPVIFFTEEYTIKQLKPVRNLGNSTLVLLNSILRNAGYSTLREF